MFVRTLIVSSLFWFFFVVSAFGQSSPVSSMERFYERSKNFDISVNQAGVYKSQSRYAATGGSFVWRAPQENVVAFNAQLPSINAGCGGIDIFAGSFSFINGDQLESLLRAIIQDAAGYAFKLAIKEISPTMSDTMQSLWDQINAINGQTINSCEQATKLVDNVIADYNAAKQQTCVVTGPEVGEYPDATGGTSCPGEGNSDKVEKAAREGDPDFETPINQNIAMTATKNTKAKDDFDLREFWMSLTGTLVILNEDETTYKYIPPIAMDPSVVRALMTGGTIKGHECVAASGSSFTKEDCLKVNEGTNEINIPISSGFLIRVRQTIGSIYDKASGSASGAFTSEELAFLEDTPLPLLRASQIYSAAYPEQGRDILLNYSEIVAYDVVLKYLETTSRQVLDASFSNTSANNDDLTKWRESVQNNIDGLLEQQMQLQQRFGVVQEFISRLDREEERVNAKVNASLLRSVGGDR